MLPSEQGAVAKACLTVFFAFSPLFADWGCIQFQDQIIPEQVEQWEGLVYTDSFFQSEEAQLHWMMLPPQKFHHSWHIIPTQRELFNQGKYCALLKGRQLAQEFCVDHFQKDEAEHSLSLFSMIASHESAYRLTVNDRVACLDALKRTEEADSLLENSLQLDSGSSWALRRAELMWLRKMKSLLSVSPSDTLFVATLDSLRERLLSRIGEKSGSTWDDSLRWSTIEFLMDRSLKLPEWGDNWMIERLGKGSGDRNAKLWEWLGQRKARPDGKSSTAQILSAASYLKTRGESGEVQRYLDLLNKRTLSASELRKMRGLQADLLFEKRQWRAAEKFYKLLVDDRPTADPQSLLQLARAHRNRGAKGQADSLYALFRERYPLHSKTAEMYWSRATAAEEVKKWDEAVAAYRLIDHRFKRERRRPWVEFRVALIDFKRERYAEAAEGFAKVAKETPQLWPHNGALLLQAESFRRQSSKGKEKEKNDSLAVASFLETIADHPVGWYAYRARTLLKEHDLLPDSLIPQVKLIEGLSEEEIAVWLRRATGARSSALNPLLSSVELNELDLFLLFGEWKMAEKWVAQQRKVMGDDPYFSFAAARLMMERGAIAESYREVRRLINRIDRRSLALAPREVMQLIYPRPYWKWVQKVAADHEIDPYFMLALIRQESTFDDQIVSPAGAIGLGQIMPATGRILAEQSSIQPFRTEMLRNPLFSIKLSALYLGNLWKKWNDPRWVLANYNAGPAPTARWVKTLSNESWELAAEEVSYWETRDYIKRVMGNWWTYLRVWGDP